MIEFKEAAVDRVFDLLEESFEDNKHQKTVLCELYDVLHDAMKEHGEDDDVLKGLLGLRRSRSNYKRGMRDYHDDNRYAY